MDKREFHKLINYLRCHPSEAKLLTEVLTSGNAEGTGESIGQKACDKWMSAREAGKQIGKSSTWMRRKHGEGMFKSARKDGNGRYIFLESEVQNDYNNYILMKYNN